MNDSDKSPPLGCWLVVVFFYFGLGLLAGWTGVRSKAIKNEQQKAIEAGVGRYVIDPATGATEFKYGKD